MTPPSRLDICKGKLGAEQPIITKTFTFRVSLRGRRGHDRALQRVVEQSDKLKFETMDKQTRQPLSWLPGRVYNLLPQVGQKEKSSSKVLPQ